MPGVFNTSSDPSSKFRFAGGIINITSIRRTAVFPPIKLLQIKGSTGINIAT